MQLGDVQKRIELRLPSAKALVLTNFMTIIVAIILQMDPSSVVWAYWLESVIIGLFTVLTLSMMSGKSFLQKDRRNSISALFMAAFFCIHYGMFHLGYFFFLYVLPWFTPNPSYFPEIGIIVGILLLSHGFSFVKNILQEPGRLVNTDENRNRFMMEPYNRIIPMHIAIIISGFVMVPLLPLILLLGTSESANSLAVQIIKTAGLVIFMTIKTLADLFGHVFYNRKKGSSMFRGSKGKQ